MALLSESESHGPRGLPRPSRGRDKGAAKRVSLGDGGKFPPEAVWNTSLVEGVAYVPKWGTSLGWVSDAG